MSEPNVAQTQATEPIAEPVKGQSSEPVVNKTISKKIYDDLASETANLKRLLKEKLSPEEAQELAEAERQKAIADSQKTIDELNEKIKNQTLKANQGLAMGLTVEVKSRAGIEDNDTEYVEFVQYLSNIDEKITTKSASYFAKIVKAAYEKGVADTAKGTRANLASGVTVGGGNNSNSSGLGKQYAEQANGKNMGKTDIFTRIN